MTGQREPYDIELLVSAQDGDVAAFTQLYRRHARAVLRYAWAGLGTRTEAEDALQETFATAWARRRNATIIDESLLPWLLATCRNHVRNQIRRRRRHHAEELGDTVVVQYDHDALLDLRHELRLLSDLDRRLCELCLVQGLSYREAALVLDTTETAVGKRLQRTRARLRLALDTDGQELPR
jgi:RNA polymerase sigma factor (sigma-70 family)